VIFQHNGTHRHLESILNTSIVLRENKCNKIECMISRRVSSVRVSAEGSKYVLQCARTNFCTRFLTPSNCTWLVKCLEAPVEQKLTFFTMHSNVGVSGLTPQQHNINRKPDTIVLQEIHLWDESPLQKPFVQNETMDRNELTNDGYYT
jgi:hypothetical protein